MKDIEKQSTADLQKSLLDKRKALFNFRVGIAGARSKNVRESRLIRKDIARILTALKERAKEVSKDEGGSKEAVSSK